MMEMEDAAEARLQVDEALSHKTDAEAAKDEAALAEFDRLLEEEAQLDGLKVGVQRLDTGSEPVPEVDTGSEPVPEVDTGSEPVPELPSASIDSKPMPLPVVITGPDPVPENSNVTIDSQSIQGPEVIKGPVARAPVLKPSVAAAAGTFVAPLHVPPCKELGKKLEGTDVGETDAEQVGTEAVNIAGPSSRVVNDDNGRNSGSDKLSNPVFDLDEMAKALSSLPVDKNFASAEVHVDTSHVVIDTDAQRAAQGDQSKTAEERVAQNPTPAPDSVSKPSSTPAQ